MKKVATIAVVVMGAVTLLVGGVFAQQQAQPAQNTQGCPMMSQSPPCMGQGGMNHAGHHQMAGKGCMMQAQTSSGTDKPATEKAPAKQ